jgi:hypothetical protein
MLNRVSLLDACEASRCLVVDWWSNDESDSVIVFIDRAITCSSSMIILCKIIQECMINQRVR